MVWGKIKRRGKLTAAAFCRQVTGRYGSYGHLIPLLTEGGRSARPTEEQYNCKKEAMRNNQNGGKKIKGRGKLTSATFCRQVAGRYGSDGPFSLF